MIDPLIVALQDAARAGFAVTVGYAGHQFYVRTVPLYVITGEATDRLKNFVVTRPELTDALGNALAVVGAEIGIDRAAKERRLADG